eukprot:4417962-Pleurochrysis_carterae.AAC.1
MRARCNGVARKVKGKVNAAEECGHSLVGLSMSHLLIVGYVNYVPTINLFSGCGDSSCWVERPLNIPLQLSNRFEAALTPTGESTLK